MEIKGILFDKDGTLIDFFKVWEPAMQPALRTMLKGIGVTDRPDLVNILMERLGCSNGHIDPEGAIAWKSYAGIANDARNILNDENITAAAEEIRRLLVSCFFAEVVEKRTSYPTFTDLPELMNFLEKNGIRIGLATTDTYISSRHCLDCLQISDAVSFWGTADGELPEKPDGRLIRLAADRWGIRPDQIAVVGDTPNDMRFAKNGGAVGIGVLSGTGSLRDLSDCADYVLPSVDQLRDWLAAHAQEKYCNYDSSIKQGEERKCHISV